jgi:UDP-galactopyranose mutase
MTNQFEYLIVGAGFAGATIAERIASVLNKTVLVIDKRLHIGGNAYDYFDENGILIHKYGPHIFHTNSEKIYSYLSKFTKWRNYQHRVLASVDGRLVPIPINLDTINQLYGTAYNSGELQEFFDKVSDRNITVNNSRDVIVQKVGEELYDKFFKNYTKKQWDLWPEELDSSVCARIPIRVNRDDRYFTDKYQVMPKDGYTKLFENMLNHPNIKIMLNTTFGEIKEKIKYEKLVFTGPVDEFFNHCYGALPYRSLKFSKDVHDKEFIQAVGTINYPNDYDYTRITEMKHLTGQDHKKTAVIYEYPTSEGDPYYPIPTQESQEIYIKYKDLAEKESEVIFTGRLGSYKYYNMDQVVGQALQIFEYKMKKVPII